MKAKPKDFFDGVDAYAREDYITAYKLFYSLAKQGDADAQFNLGAIYKDGDGVKQDDKEALKWFRLAAEQGNAEARKIIKKLDGSI